MKKTLIASVLAFAPVLAFAQTNFTSIQSAINSITVIIADLIPLVIGIAVLVFLWGLISYVTAGGDEEKRDAARNTIIWGIVIIFVMTAVWGFVRILETTFFNNTNTSAAVGGPAVQVGGGLTSFSSSGK